MKTVTKNYYARLALSLSVFMVLLCSADAQETPFRPSSWRWGLQGAYQLNTAGLGWQQLHGTDLNFHSEPGSIDYVDGTGSSFYGGAVGEYLSSSWWGIQMRLSYDARNALVIDDTRKPIPSFDTKVSYISFAPLFRADQKLIPNLSMYFGPVFVANLKATYAYNANPDGTSAELPAVTEPEVNVPNVRSISYGIEGGFAYDITVARFGNRNSMLISPFVDWSWIVGQRETINEPTQNSISDVWSTVSYRLGLRVSMDYKDATPTETQRPPTPIVQSPPVVTKTVIVIAPPENTILTKNVRGYFPIHPYVFFEKGNNQIPSRYAVLSRATAQNFKESELENFMRGDVTVKETNVNQLMTTYYNVMNIYADRMRRNPSEQLTLRGCDPDRINGQVYANNVKAYLVNNFDIDASRISIIVEDPKKPSGTYYTDPAFSGLIDDENRRVAFVFSNPDMLRSVNYTIRDESSIDNDMIFTIPVAIPFKSWDVTIAGEGRSMYFGPFTYNYERINPAELMRFLESGSYVATVTLTDNNERKTVENVPFKLSKERQVRNASRYLMLFDYDKSDAISKYENRIRTEISPGLIEGNRVIVHGHTDLIGNPTANLMLSQERSDQAKSIIDDGLRAENKKIDVQSIGIGQEEMQYTFNNQFPEGRMYNRNVFVEVIE